MRRVAEAGRSIKAISANITLSWNTNGELRKTSGRVLLQKPNYAVLKLSGDYELRLLVSDGKSIYTYNNEKTYTKGSTASDGNNIAAPWWSLPIRFFFTQTFNPFGKNDDPATKLHWVGIQKISGKAYSVVTVKSANPMPYEATLFFSQDGVLERSTVRVVYSSSRTTTFDAQLSNIQINPSISRSSFLIAPTPNTMLETKHPKSDILDIGDLVPEFRLPTETGVDWSLLKERKHAKLTLINFWYLNCAPCMLEFPDLEKLYQQAHARGFNIVAIDKSDSATAIAKYAQRAHLTFPLVMGGEERRGSIFQRYHVSAFPTSYLIDAKGRIVWRSLGPNSEDLRAELIKRGMLNN